VSEPEKKELTEAEKLAKEALDAELAERKKRLEQTIAMSHAQLAVLNTIDTEKIARKIAEVLEKKPTQ